MKRYKAIRPLVNFQIPWSVLIGHTQLTREESSTIFRERRKKVVEGINLIEGVKIRLASKEDLEDLNIRCFSAFDPAEKYSPQTFVLIKHYKSKTYFKFERVMRDVILALRLLKEGYVSAGHIFHIHLPEKRSLALTTLAERPRRRITLKYALEFDEIPILRRILKKIQAVDFTERKSFGLACKRFQRGYEEEDLDDRLIDFMIAFEALFLKGEKGGVSSGKVIAVACSALLGENEEEREEIKLTLAEAYKIRNYVVHGSEYPPPKSEDVEYLPDLVSKVENYLRESIKKLLE